MWLFPLGNDITPYYLLLVAFPLQVEERTDNDAFTPVPGPGEEEASVPESEEYVTFDEGLEDGEEEREAERTSKSAFPPGESERR